MNGYFFFLLFQEQSYGERMIVRIHAENKRGRGSGQVHESERLKSIRKTMHENYEL